MTAIPAASVPAARLLVVDDERLVRRVAREMLVRAGFAVQEAGDGAAALEIVHGGALFDAVLLDVMMPRLSGLETFRGLRALRPQLPIVLTSGYCDPGTLAPFGAVAGFVLKPFSAATLVRALQEAVRTRAVTAA